MTFSTMLTQLLGGLIVSIEIFFLTLLGSMPFGLLIAFGRMSKNRALSLVVRFYISVMRGTPLVLQLMVVYFGPSLIFGLNMGSNYRFPALIIGMVFNYAAYFAEIFRSGIQSMPTGQHEAAQILGYQRTQAFIKIIFPQAVKRVLPAITNEVITLVKDTSLAYVISVMEMFTLAKKIASSQSTLMPFIIAGVFYYLFNLIVAAVLEFIEKKASYYR